MVLEAVVLVQSAVSQMSRERQRMGAYAKSDSVSLSNAASLVALAKASSTSRQAKIQTLSADVKSGRYQTDTSQVSHAVVESHIQG